MEDLGPVDEQWDWNECILVCAYHVVVFACICKAGEVLTGLKNFSVNVPRRVSRRGAYLRHLIAVERDSDVTVVGRHEHARRLLRDGRVAGLRCLR